MQDYLGLGTVATAIGLTLTVWAWKMSPQGANWMLVVAWILFAISLYVSMPWIAKQAFVPRVLWTCFGAAIVGLVLYHSLWTSSNGRDAAPRPGALQVHLECWPTQLPEVIPPNTQWFVWFVGLADQDMGVMWFNIIPMPRSGPDGGRMAWNDRPNPPSMLGMVCKLTNYSGTVLFDVELSVKLQAREVVHLGAGKCAPGKVTAEHDGTIRAPMIDADENSPFVLYLANNSQVYITVTVLGAASALPAGMNERRNVHLVRMGETERMELTPRDLSSLSK